MKVSLRWMTGLCLSLALLGCGEDPYQGPQRYPLTGTVTFNGEPVDGGAISFIPQGGKENPTGGTITGGKYSVAEDRGANAGKYRVEITWPKPTGKKVKSEDTGEMVDVTAEVIPPKYNTMSELTADVSETNTTFNFDLK
jgi:hypothetical protein